MGGDRKILFGDRRRLLSGDWKHLLPGIVFRSRRRGARRPLRPPVRPEPRAAGPARTLSELRPHFRLHGYAPEQLEETLAPLASRPGPPEVEVHHDVLYHPAHPGLYAADGSRLDASWPRRGPRREVAAHGPERWPGPPPRRRAAGPVAYLGHPFAKHYGHFLTEGIARLWYAFEDEACALLCHDLHLRNPFARSFLDEFVEALPDVRRRLVAFRRPTRIGTVVLPGPSLSNRCEGSDAHARAPEAVARALLPRPPERTGQPLYLSRSRLAGGLRQVRGEAELEARLARAGVAVRHPETLSLGEQIELVNRHAVLVGPTGSALHNLLFGLVPGQPIVHLANREELPGTYLLIDVMKRAEAHYVAALTTDPDSRKSVSKRDWILDGEAAVAALRTLGVVGHDG